VTLEEGIPLTHQMVYPFHQELLGQRLETLYRHNQAEHENGFNLILNKEVKR
jgi:hypothetical protein